jgi:hypothetical protein
VKLRNSLARVTVLVTRAQACGADDGPARFTPESTDIDSALGHHRGLAV